MGVVAVYALNDEFKSVLRESKNGMVTGFSYVLAKTVLVLPMFFIFAIFALGIPAFAIQDNEPQGFGPQIILFAAVMFVFESVAEALSVWFEDPIIGMLQFMNFWFGAFLFGGFLIAPDDMYWPFRLFYYIMPYGAYARSTAYEIFSYATFAPCDPATNQLSAICIPETDGLKVLEALSNVFPLLSSSDNFIPDLVAILAIGVFYKVLYVVGVLYKSTLVTKIHEK